MSRPLLSERMTAALATRWRLDAPVADRALRRSGRGGSLADRLRCGCDARPVGQDAERNATPNGIPRLPQNRPRRWVPNGAASATRSHDGRPRVAGVRQRTCTDDRDHALVESEAELLAEAATRYTAAEAGAPARKARAVGRYTRRYTTVPTPSIALTVRRDNRFEFRQLQHDPAGARTQDLRIKSPLLYQLSYRVARAGR